jgi:hypothetical protein
MADLSEKRYNGECFCGRVSFTIAGKQVENAYCHCRLCTRARGLYSGSGAIYHRDAFTITRGEEYVKDFGTPQHKITSTGLHFHAKDRPSGTLHFCFCSECGSLIYQNVTGLDLLSVTPVNFNIENEDESVSCGVNCKLPQELLPRCHFNYENRQWDVHDDLPKFKGVPPSKEPRMMMNNDGSIKES